MTNKYFKAFCIIFLSVFLYGCANEYKQVENDVQISDTPIVKRNISLTNIHPNDRSVDQLSSLNFVANNNVANKRRIFSASDDFNSDSFRIPGQILLNNGDLVGFAQVQYAGASDYTHQDIGFARSSDFGETWYDKKIIAPAAGPNSRMLNPTLIYDDELNKIIMLVTEIHSTSRKSWWTNNDDDIWDIYVYVSGDYGVTWQKTNIKESIISERDPFNNVVMAGLGTGIKLEDGTYIFAAEVGYDDGEESRILNNLIYSKNLVNWRMSNPTPEMGDEANIVKMEDENILMNARNHRTYFPKTRKIFVTDDLGETWSKHETHQTIQENRATMGHTLKIDIDGKDYIIFSHILSESWTRKNLVLSVLNDAGTDWNLVGLIEPEEFAGYSFLSWNKRFDDKLFIAYEKDGGLLNVDISHLLPTIKKRAAE